MLYKFSVGIFGAIFLFAGLTEAQLPAAPNGKVVNINGAGIYIEEESSDEPLILMHGFGGTTSDWEAYIPVFSKHYRVITWDMRGHGRSTNPDTIQSFLHAAAARDLLALTDALKLQKVKLIGHSSGGIVALYAANMKPSSIESMVLVSAQAYYSDSVRSFIRRNARPEAYYEFMGLSKYHGAEKGRLLARHFFHFHELEGDPAITSDQLASIRSRTLIVHGDNDFIPVSHAWEMYRSIPGAPLSIIPNGWHQPHTGEHNKNIFIKQALGFLKGEWDNLNSQMRNVIRQYRRCHGDRNIHFVISDEVQNQEV